MNSTGDPISILLHKTLQTLYILMTKMNPSRLSLLSTLLPIVSWRLGGGSGNRFSITEGKKSGLLSFEAGFMEMRMGA
jgi:hypothetical protein